MDTVKPAVPEVLQVSVGDDKERLLATSEFVTKHANDPCCREVSNTEGKQGSVYLYDRNGILIRQAQIDDAQQNVYPFHYVHPYCT